MDEGCPEALHDVGFHRHLKNDLSGLVWDYLTERVVWRTSLAAEYPCGLCFAWVQALKRWLQSDDGCKWVNQRSLVRVGKFGTTLVRGENVKGPLCQSVSTSVSSTEKREAENREAIAGLRDAAKASSRSHALRHVVQKVRAVIDECFDNEVLSPFEADVKDGRPFEWAMKVRAALGRKFGAEVDTQKCYQIDLWRCVLREAGDCEANIIPAWLESVISAGNQV